MRYPVFLEHQANKTAGQFFPPLYEEYFSKWGPTPTKEQIKQAGGDMAIATAAVRQIEENVRDFGSTKMISSKLITRITIRRSTV